MRRGGRQFVGSHGATAARAAAAIIWSGRAIWSRPRAPWSRLEAYDDARDILRYLIATQQPDGHWFQNQWLGGAAFWQGVQLDEAAFPILLASALREKQCA